jgi:hypothetical protein
LQIEQKFVKITENNSNNYNYMEEEKPLLSIGPDGIKFNLNKGSSIKTNSTKTFMKGVDQKVNGGVLEHRATEELTQIGNIMKASDGGKILNEVDGGNLNQQNNQMIAEKKGTITNKVIKKGQTAVWILLLTAIAGIVGFWNDIVSLIDRYIS